MGLAKFNDLVEHIKMFFHCRINKIQSVNDTARFLGSVTPDPKAQFGSQPEEHLQRTEHLSLDETLTSLAHACDEQDAPFATALVNSYMGRTRDRNKLIQTLMFESH